MRAALAALGVDPERFELQIMQLVHVVESGERAQMSKRKGEFVTLDELIDDIGVDAARLFMLQRSHDTTVDLDLELARKQSNDNPVYYVQYAHARIASILRKAGEGAEGARRERSSRGRAAARSSRAERELVKRLLELPGEVREAAEKRAPHRLCTYATGAPPTSTASIATARWSAPRARGSRTRGWRSASDQAHDRAHAGAARDQRARADVVAPARVLLIGSTGFTGGHFLEAARAAGFDVNTAARKPGAADLTCDLLDPGSVRDALAEVSPDAVVNLAGVASVARSWGEPGAAFEVNAAGVINLLAAVADVKPEAHMLCVSSGEVYGAPSEDELPLREEARWNPSAHTARARPRWRWPAVSTREATACGSA